MSNALKRLIDILTLTQESPNLFLGKNQNIGLPHIFGGQIIAQSMAAAMNVVDPQRQLHACYSTFLQVGELDSPLYFQTEILREGNSFSIVNVNVIQKEQRICQATVSFQLPENGLDHQIAIPSIPLPCKLNNEAHHFQKMAEYLPSPLKELIQTERAFDVQITHLNNPFKGKKLPAEQTLWAKLNGEIPHRSLSQGLQQCLIAYFSDYHCIQTMLHPHKVGIMQEGLKIATLNHNIYFHRGIDFSDWLLFSLRNTNAYGARGLTHGEVFSKDGSLLMSYQQEGLIRLT